MSLGVPRGGWGQNNLTSALVFILIAEILLHRFYRSQPVLGYVFCVKGLRRGEIFVFVFIFGEDRRNEVETTKSTISAKCDE